MLFTEPLFLFFFLPITLVVYWAVPVGIQNILILVMSLVFYAWGEAVYLVPMLLLILINHLLAKRLARLADLSERKRVVRLTAITNVFLLLCVVYGEWLVRYVFRLAGVDLPPFNVAPPLGVAFFTLQAMTIVFEIARGKAELDGNIIDTGLHIAFLPTVLAGPIVRYSDLAPQFRQRTMTAELLGLGCERFIIGLGKLVILAVPLYTMASDIFARSAAGNQYTTTPVTLAWLGVVAFGLQFYLTLSGISDMAIGLARMFGFRIQENFKYPYAAHTLAEFWNRWHISLYRWFYVYVFMVLGGSRAKLVKSKGKVRPKNFVVRNYFVLWVLIGFWHGISWSHIIFALWFFFFTFMEWVVSLQRKQTRSPLWLLYVLPVVSVGWVFLKCHSLMEAFTYLSNLIGISSNGLVSDFTTVLLRENWHVLLLGILAATPLAAFVMRWLRRPRGTAGTMVLGFVHVIVLAGIALLCFVFLSEGTSIPPWMYY